MSDRSSIWKGLLGGSEAIRTQASVNLQRKCKNLHSQQVSLSIYVVNTGLLGKWKTTNEKTSGGDVEY